MDGGRRGSSRTIAGLGSACIACVALAPLACGDAFTTAPSGGGGDGGGNQDAIASGDAIAAPDAGKGWCASQGPGHTFCEDFSLGVPDMLSTMPSGGGTITADTTDFTSAPQSLLATTPSLVNSNAAAGAIAYKAFSAAAGTHFSLSLDLKIEASCLPKNDQNGVSVIALDFTESNYGLLIALLPDEIDALEVALTGPTVTQSHQFQISVPTGWQRWILDVNGALSLTSSTTKTFALAVGATTVFSKEPLQKAPTLAIQHPELVVGAIVKNTQNQSPACKVRVDDILFDVRAAGAPL
jgi:hypothetical protein